MISFLFLERYRRVCRNCRVLFTLPCAKKTFEHWLDEQKTIDTEPNIEQLRKPKPNSIPEDEIFYTPFEVIGEESTSFGFSSFDMTTDAALVDAVALLEGAVPVDGDDITPQGDTTPPSLFGTPIY